MSTATLPVIGAVDAEHAAAFDEACQMAVKLLERTRFLRVLATGQVLAEVPEHELEFWALGKTEAEAKTALLKVVSAILQRRLVSAGRGA